MVHRRLASSELGRIAAGTAATTALLLLSGCASNAPPHPRLGSLPFPGAFTLYEAADPDDLGNHHYGKGGSLFIDEQQRGIMYTCRAGFLDVAHVRDTIDLTRFFYLQSREAIEHGRSQFVLRGVEPSRFHITIEMLAQPKGFESAAIEHIAHQRATELAARIAWIATNWHEIITWFGYKSTIIIPEHSSSFTYEDVISHAVGVRIATAALHHNDLDFDHAVTIELERALRDLRVVSREQAEEAIGLVEHKWWKDGRSLKRYIDIGLDDHIIDPWIAPGFAPCGGIAPKRFVVPRLDDSDGVEAGFSASIMIEPGILEAGAIRALLPDQPEMIDPARHFPLLMDHIRQNFTQELGEHFDRPD